MLLVFLTSGVTNLAIVIRVAWQTLRECHAHNSKTLPIAALGLVSARETNFLYSAGSLPIT